MANDDTTRMTAGDPAAAASAPEATVDPDDALIRWMLSLTPAQRLDVAQGFIDSMQALRDGARP